MQNAQQPETRSTGHAMESRTKSRTFDLCERTAPARKSRHSGPMDMLKTNFRRPMKLSNLSLLRHVFPGVCIACAVGLSPEEPFDLCAHCRAALPRVRNPCPRCALPLTADQSPTAMTPEKVAGRVPPSDRPYCHACTTAPPAFSRAIVPLRYEGLITTWIHSLKNHLGMAEGRVLGTLLAEAAIERLREAKTPDLIIPVPLRWSRLALRGHNQALTLGRHVARALGVRIDAHAARRVGHAPPQRGLDRAERRRNLAGVFSARYTVAGRRVAIVDDVMTTGSTAESLAQTLLSAGASEVLVMAVARTTLLQEVPRGIPKV